MENTKITKEEVLKDEQVKGTLSAQSLLILGGPDMFDGTYEEYKELVAELEKRI